MSARTRKLRAERKARARVRMTGVHEHPGHFLRMQRAKGEGLDPHKPGRLVRVMWSDIIEAAAYEPITFLLPRERPKLNKRGLPYDRSDLKRNT